jgi:hypothetical protein
MSLRRVCLGVAAVAAMCAPGAVALASSSAYSVKLNAPGTVRRAHPFAVTASGSAQRRSHLVLILAQQPCSSSYVLEFNAIGAWQRGDSYFQRGHGRGSRSLVSNAYKVHGSFRVTATAHAGSRTGTAYVCAYIPSHDPTVTRAHSGAAYRVTP